jgi:hypothetical protein
MKSMLIPEIAKSAVVIILELTTAQTFAKTATRQKSDIRYDK